jgi:flavin-dependent dehydrogenase
MAEAAFEICVVGGGPAGGLAAIRLAQLGHRVCLVEQRASPHPRVGESLSPGIRPIFDLLGLGALLGGSAFRAPGETWLCWQKAQPKRVPQAYKEGGLLVDRGVFDAMIQQVAREAGVHMIQPARAEVERAPGGWRIAISGRDKQLLFARFLIDAGGRRGCLGGPRIPFSPKTVAVWAKLSAAGNETTTRVEAIADGWLWAAPIGGRSLSLMFFCDPETIRHRGSHDLEQLLQQKLARTELFARWAMAPRDARLRLYDASCTYSPEIVGTDFLKIGEANYTLDPLSSTGVEKALQTALVGAVAARTLLLQPERAALCDQLLRERQREVVNDHTAWTGDYYREVERYAHERFWAARRTEPEMAGIVPWPETRAPLPRAETRVRLGPGVSVVGEPCVVGAWIECRPALRSPGLARPVVFLGGVEIASLLTALPPVTTWAGLLAQWSAEVSLAKAERLAFWLWERQVLLPTA